eukprot:46577-Eustigmatos_ZCMA.PRE.1
MAGTGSDDRRHHTPPKPQRQCEVSATLRVSDGAKLREKCVGIKTTIMADTIPEPPNPGVPEIHSGSTCFGTLSMRSTTDYFRNTIHVPSGVNP